MRAIDTIVPLLAALMAQPADRRPPPRASFDTLAREAEAAAGARRFDEALALYRRALRLKPDWEDGLWGAGSIEYDQDHYAQCSADFSKLAAVQPGRSSAWIMAGLCQYRLRDYEKALQSLQRAKQIGFQDGDELGRTAQLHLALVLTRLGSFEKALGQLIALVHNEQPMPETVVATGIAGLRRPWIPPEVPEAERDKVYRLGKAMTAVIRNETPSAIQQFDSLLRDYPADGTLHFRYGAFLMESEPERGIQEIRKTLELEPDHLPALTGLAAIYLKRDQPAEARTYAEKAARVAPADFAARMTLGRVLRVLDDTGGAAREYEAAVRLAPASPEAHFNLSTIYSRLGRKEDAVRERETFLRLRKPDDPNLP